MPTVTKKNLLDFLGHANDNYTMGLAAHELFNMEEVYPLIEKLEPVMDADGVKFDFLALWLTVPQVRERVNQEFRKMCLRTFLSEMIESVQEYCDTTNQKDLLKSQPWFDFARLIRNSLSHKGYFTFRPWDKSLLPVTWNGKTITLAMDGTYADLDLCNYTDVYLMHDEVRAFVETQLS